MVQSQNHPTIATTDLVRNAETGSHPDAQSHRPTDDPAIHFPECLSGSRPELECTGHLEAVSTGFIPLY
ncbi:hypothetical protein CKO25_01950 [Thiocapsa imhoffii]|uniref:Uncharacterized protein n=1 Tax=Thiocapsa imhoffii TaxID=382777 RepID=A0A9X0WF66_9GAMM|nr:hypothetical protein [Thiocapsa imhoffii]